MNELDQHHILLSIHGSIQNGLLIKGSVRKVVWVYVEKYSMVIATNLTSICCVYKEKIVKNDSYRGT